MGEIVRMVHSAGVGWGITPTVRSTSGPGGGHVTLGSPAVELLDDATRLTHDHRPPQLETRCELTTLLGPGVREDHELPHGLGLGHGLVRLIDRGLPLRAKAVVVDEVRDGRRLPVVAGPPLDGVR